jgi:hypothetical protein
VVSDSRGHPALAAPRRAHPQQAAEGGRMTLQCLMFQAAAGCGEFYIRNRRREPRVTQEAERKGLGLSERPLQHIGGLPAQGRRAGVGVLARVCARARRGAMSLTLLPLQDCQRRPLHPDERAAGRREPRAASANPPRGGQWRSNGYTYAGFGRWCQGLERAQEGANLVDVKVCNPAGRHLGWWGECGEMVAPYFG